MTRCLSGIIPRTEGGSMADQIVAVESSGSVNIPEPPAIQEAPPMVLAQVADVPTVEAYPTAGPAVVPDPNLL